VKETFDFFNNHPIDKDIELWGQEVFKDKKYGLFINYANRYNEELAQKVHQYVEPYLQSFGIPMRGMSTTIILGNYGWTPLGIHSDEEGEYILHFHLGPGEKDMYIWEKETGKKLGYKKGEKIENTDKYLKNYDHKSTFKTGDLFSMPGRCIHIGNTKEFSIGLVIEFNNLTKREFAERLWFRLGDQLFSKTFRGKEAIILPPYKAENHDVFIENLIREIKHYNIDPRTFLKEALRKIYRDHKYSLFSNAGFSVPSTPQKETIKVDEITSDKRIICKQPFKIMYYREKEKLYVFVRGSKIVINYHEDISLLIDEINKGQPIQISEIEKRSFCDWNSKNPLLKFIAVLYNYRGIEFSDNPII